MAVWGRLNKAFLDRNSELDKLDQFLSQKPLIEQIGDLQKIILDIKVQANTEPDSEIDRFSPKGCLIDLLNKKLSKLVQLRECKKHLILNQKCRHEQYQKEVHDMAEVEIQKTFAIEHEDMIAPVPRKKLIILLDKMEVEMAIINDYIRLNP